VRMRRYEENKCSRNVAAVPEVPEGPAFPAHQREVALTQTAPRPVRFWQACTELRRALPLCARDRLAQESPHTKDVGRRHRMQGWPGPPCARVPQGTSW
jgi:hypothetical protein